MSRRDRTRCGPISTNFAVASIGFGRETVGNGCDRAPAQNGSSFARIRARKLTGPLRSSSGVRCSMVGPPFRASKHLIERFSNLLERSAARAIPLKDRYGSQARSRPDLFARLSRRLNDALLKLDIWVKRRGGELGLFVPARAGERNVRTRCRERVLEFHAHEVLKLTALERMAKPVRYVVPLRVVDCPQPTTSALNPCLGYFAIICGVEPFTQ